MKVHELIRMLERFPNKDAEVFLQCALQENCGYSEPTYLAMTPDEKGCDIQSIPFDYPRMTSRVIILP